MDERERLILIARAKQKQEAERRAPSTNVVEQAGTGTSEGIAGMAGMPVDLLTKGINAVGGLAGMPPIQNPVGGSESIKGILSPFMSEAEPQTMGQRLARRVGQDVGAGAVAAPVAGISTLGQLGMSAGSNAASGLAGGLTSEATDNPYANIIASLAGGAMVPGAAYAMRDYDAPSVDDLKASAGGRYRQVEQSDFTLSPEQTQELKGNISARMYDEYMDPPMHPNAAGAVRRMYDVDSRAPEGSPTLQDIRDANRWVRTHVTNNTNASPGEAELGGAIQSEVKDYLQQVAPDNPDVQAWRDADALTRRYKNAETLDDAMDSASLAAGSSGTGGNSINAMRQAIKNSMLKGKQAQYLNPQEQAAARQIVEGTRSSNALRHMAGLAPTKGVLPGMGLMAQGAAVFATGNPLFAAPAVVGSIAKGLGEKLTESQINRLSVLLRTGEMPSRALSAGERAVLSALLASQGQQQLLQSQ